MKNQSENNVTKFKFFKKELKISKIFYFLKYFELEITESNIHVFIPNSLKEVFSCLRLKNLI